MRRRDVLGGIAGLSVLGAAGGTTGSTTTMAGSADTDIYQAAFFYGFGLYEFARTALGRAGPDGGRFNRVGHVARLLDHTARVITAPNNDTVYSSAQLELSGGPVEVVSPSDMKRYFSIAFTDAFTDNFAYIGTRATQGRGQRQWRMPPVERVA